MALLRITTATEALRLEGEIDLAVADQFQEALRASIASGTTSVDLSGVTFMDSSAVSILLMAGKRLDGQGPLVLLRPSNAVRRALDEALPGGHHALAVRYGSGDTETPRVSQPRLSERLKAARSERGLSQAQAARELGVARSAYRLWEMEAALPAPQRWQTVATWLGVTVTALLLAEGLISEDEASP